METIKIDDLVKLLGGKVYENNQWTPTNKDNYKKRIENLLCEERERIYVSMCAQESRRG